MVKRTTIAIAATAAALVIALAGCSAGANSDGSAQARNFSAENATGDDTPTPEPSAVETPTPEPWPYTEAEDGRATYLAAVKAPDSINGIELPNDDELIADARKACDQLAAGVPFDSVDAIADNPNPPMVNGKRTQITNSRSLAGLASETLCTEYNQRNVAP